MSLKNHSNLVQPVVDHNSQIVGNSEMIAQVPVNGVRGNLGPSTHSDDFWGLTRQGCSIAAAYYQELLKVCTGRRLQAP